MTTTQPAIDINEVTRHMAPVQDYMTYHMLLPTLAFFAVLVAIIVLIRLAR